MNNLSYLGRYDTEYSSNCSLRACRQWYSNNSHHGSDHCSTLLAKVDRSFCALKLPWARPLKSTKHPCLASRASGENLTPSPPKRFSNPSKDRGICPPSARMHRVNHSCRRIDSRVLLPERSRLPHVNCYPAAGLRGGGGDSEATEHGNTPRAEGCD
jgi:hypothetical protein